MSVTIKAIAQKTGLSIPTVGNVLGRSAWRYSAETRKRVVEAAKELGYRPNSSARAMRQGRVGCAALVLSRSHQSILSHIPVGLLDGLDDELSLHNMHLAVSRLTDEQLSNEDFVPKVLREYMADGMIVNYTHGIPPRMLELIHAHHTPAVWLNAKLKEDCVYPDDRDAAERATALLISRGHRRIAMIHLVSPDVWPNATFQQSRQREHYSVNDRIAGYVEAMTAAGLSPRVVCDDRFVPDNEALGVCRTVLTGSNRPTAALLYSERDCASVVVAASSVGLSIPRDLAVLGFYPIEQTIAGINLPAVQIPTAETGRCAVRMLLQKMKSPGVPCTAHAVKYVMPAPELIAPPAES